MPQINNGLVIVMTGDGKGKTTAALGLALRAIGQDIKVLMVQFIKGKWKTGETNSAALLGRRFKMIQMGTGFTWDSKNPEEDLDKAVDTFNICKEAAIGNEYGMLIMDEINNAVLSGMIPVKDVINLIKNKNPELHLVLTGRNAAPEIIELADIVTEMKEIKHSYKNGISAQKGIEF